MVTQKEKYCYRNMNSGLDEKDEDFNPKGISV